MFNLGKRLIGRELRRMGYCVRRIHHNEVGGVDLGHDLRVHFGNAPGLVLFDVGANRGQTIDFFLETFMQPQVIAFEPSPTSFATLREGYGNRSTIKLENIALGNKCTRSQLHVSESWSTNDSLLSQLWDTNTQKVDVEVLTIDEYCKANSISKIDFLKIDTQGNDLNVLNGAVAMLSRLAIRAISVEIIFLEMYVGQPSFQDFLDFLTPLRYQLLGVYEQTYLDEKLWYLNACFLACTEIEGKSGFTTVRKSD